MARHFQSGFGFGSGQRSFDSRTGSGSGLGSMSGSLGPSSLSASGSRMSGSGGLSYSSTYDSGLNTSRYGTSSYSQSGYDNQSYSSSSYQNQNPGYSTSNTAAYYGGPPRSGLGGTSSSTYSGSYIGLGTSGVMATREFGGSGFDSVYDKSGQSSGSRLDSDYRRDTDYRGGSGTGYTGSNSNLRSTTDTLTLSDFIDDKRGDKSWDPVKRKYRYEPDEEDTSKRQRYSRGSSEGE